MSIESKSALSGCTIAFDLDGTLADTAPDIHNALNIALSAEDLPPATLADVRSFVGTGTRALVIKALSAYGAQGNDAKVERVTAAVFKAYDAEIAARTHVFPGLLAALDTLQHWGAALCVCTNKRTDLSVKLLTQLGLQHRFAAIVGSDSVKNRKPHPDHYIHAIRAAHGDPARSIMVGDSINDVLSAKAAGAPVAVYAYGYTDTAPDLLGADAVFTQFTDLPDLLVRLLGAQPTARM